MEKVGKDGVPSRRPRASRPRGDGDGMQFDRGYLRPTLSPIGEDERCWGRYSDSDKRSRREELSHSWRSGAERQPCHHRGDVEGERVRPWWSTSSRARSRCGRQAPGFGDRRRRCCASIALLTGGQVISEEVGLQAENATHRSRSRQADRHRQGQHTIVGRKAKRRHQGRITRSKVAIEKSTSDYDKESAGAAASSLGVPSSKNRRGRGPGTGNEGEEGSGRGRSRDAGRGRGGIVPGGGVATDPLQHVSTRSRHRGREVGVEMSPVPRGADRAIARCRGRGPMGRQVRKQGKNLATTRPDVFEIGEGRGLDPQVARTALRTRHRLRLAPPRSAWWWRRRKRTGAGRPVAAWRDY